MSADNLNHPTKPELTTGQRLLTPLKFVLRGLAISLPTVLTFVILLWILKGVNQYLIEPATSAVKWVLSQPLDESVEVESLVKLRGAPELEVTGRNYLVTPKLRDSFTQEIERRRALPNSELTEEPLSEWLADETGVYVPYNRRAVPYEHYLVVARQLHANEMPTSATGLYMEYAAETSFGSLLNLSLVAIALIFVILYFLGRFVTARVGAWIIHKFEVGVLGRLPVIRNVYGSVKQVTDFLFSENQVDFRRVVAVEYPRRGVWSLGMVTGDSMLDITTAVGEPCITVFVVNSPIPLTGWTICLPRSHVLDLDMTVEQAMNFGFSCGVLVPPHQKVTPEMLRQQLEKRFAGELHVPGTTRKRPPLIDEESP
jgi:uncharacterized membrane protein